MFSNHIKGVCYALVESVSNAMAERLNGKIQIIKTIGRGYRKFEILEVQSSFLMED
jgi:transposase